MALGAAGSGAVTRHGLTNNCEEAVVKNGSTISIEPFPGSGRRQCFYFVYVVKCIPTSVVHTYVVRRCASDGGAENLNLTLNPITGLLEATPEFTFCPGDSEVTVSQGFFSDDQYDVDGDGRFTYADRDLLQDNLFSTSTDFIPKFDFDESGDVSQDDVDVLTRLIDAGLDSNLLGDDNGDGVVDCDDLALIVPFPTDSMGDAGYIIGVDANLDGVLDGTDAALAYQAIQPADVVPDGVVDLTDWFAFFDAFDISDTVADINHDSSVDLTDFFLFLSAFDAACA